MRTSQISTLLAALATTTIAIPTTRQDPLNYALTISSTVPALSGLPVNATSNAFWVGLPTTTFCPTGEPCSIFLNTTVLLLAGTPAPADLSADVAGGQDLYVAEVGELMFTEAHTEGIFPAGAISTGFAVEGGQFVWEGPESSGWYVCWGGELPVQVLARVPAAAECADFLAVEIITNPVVGVGAFEYL